MPFIEKNGGCWVAWSKKWQGILRISIKINKYLETFYKSMNEIQSQIKTFLAKFFGNHDLQPDEDIFALGFVNSMFAMQLVLFVEQEFNISVENEDLELENFRTIKAIANLVERKSINLVQQ
jgi:methoxymalonate biosynthesis acyl carrier protein